MSITYTSKFAEKSKKKFSKKFGMRFVTLRGEVMEVKRQK